MYLSIGCCFQNLNPFICLSFNLFHKIFSVSVIDDLIFLASSNIYLGDLTLLICNNPSLSPPKGGLGGLNLMDQTFPMLKQKQFTSQYLIKAPQMGGFESHLFNQTFLQHFYSFLRSFSKL